MVRRCASTVSRLAPPSGRARDQAMPELVVASALKPRLCRNLALPASQGLGRIKQPFSCRARKVVQAGLKVAVMTAGSVEWRRDVPHNLPGMQGIATPGGRQFCCINIQYMEIATKLEILADAAKYDASCASSGAPRRDSKGRAGLGASTGAGICHSFTPDGRCVSLLKILLTNFCQYDCQYCVNRRSSNVPRARFLPREVVDLTLDFYRRNYIDGLFLSSGIIRNADYTMEQLVQVARSLRETHQFRGYIHLKTIPDADPRLITLAGQYADRLSVNIELPTDKGLYRLAPEKNAGTIKRAMGSIRLAQETAREEKRRNAPAGQSTQMIVGADDADDRAILNTAQALYGAYKLKRVYYSAFSPIPDSPSGL